MYSITSFFNYLISRVIILSPEDINNKEIFDELTELINKSKLSFKKPVLDTVKEYFSKKLSFSSFKNGINAMKDWEFLYNLMPFEFLPIDDFEQIIEDKRERYKFLMKFIRSFNMFIHWLFYFLKNEDEIHKRGAKAINDVLVGLKQVKTQASDKLKSLTAPKNGINKKNLHDLAALFCFHNIIIKFLFEYFRPKLTKRYY